MSSETVYDLLYQKINLVDNLLKNNLTNKIEIMFEIGILYGIYTVSKSELSKHDRRIIKEAINKYKLKCYE